MNKKAISMTTTFLVLVFGSFILASAMIFKGWASTNKCVILQGECQGTRYDYCCDWINTGTRPDWSSDIKTCKRTDSTYEEIPCPEPDFTECQDVECPTYI